MFVLCLLWVFEGQGRPTTRQVPVTKRTGTDVGCRANNRAGLRDWMVRGSTVRPPNISPYIPPPFDPYQWHLGVRVEPLDPLALTLAALPTLVLILPP